MRSIHEILNRQYYKKSSWILILLPLSFIYFLIIYFRIWAYRIGIFKSIKMDVPVVVIGNITIGGTGKTPLVIWLLERLIKKGMKPGLICSGYNSNAKSPKEVLLDSKVSNVGDEALMIKLRFKKNYNKDIPIFVGKRKVHVGQALLESYPNVNILISDDGLQHYELERDFEIVVVDEARQFGNKFLIPAGPLRESVSKINEVDALVLNGHLNASEKYDSMIEKKNKNINEGLAFKMTYYGDVLVNCFNRDQIFNLDILAKKNLVAITGIGNPERFFNQLIAAKIPFIDTKIFNDHHVFTKSDFKIYSDMNIIMTEKDAVKCKKFVNINYWYLPIYVDLDEKLFKKMVKKLRIN